MVCLTNGEFLAKPIPQDPVTEEVTGAKFEKQLEKKSQLGCKHIDPITASFEEVSPADCMHWIDQAFGISAS